MVSLVAYILTDMALLSYIYAGSAAIRVWMGAPPESLAMLGYAAVLFYVAHVGAMAVCQGYDFSRRRGTSDVAFSGAAGVVSGTIASFLLFSVFLLYYAPDAPVISRSVYVAGGMLSLIALCGWRIWYVRLRRNREPSIRVMIVGSSDSVRSVARELVQYSRAGHEVVGCVCDKEGVTEGASPEEYGFKGSLDELPALIRGHEVNEILFVAQGLLRPTETMEKLVRLCEQHDIDLHVLPDFYEAMVGKLDLYEIGGLPLIGVRGHLGQGGYMLAKRVMDVAAATIGLLVALPVLAVTTVLIKLDSPGPVFYRQKRCGRSGREFDIIKLRSMRTDAEKLTGPVWASKDDPRITRIGRFLRAKRIDEIPQLWNVLKGDMSMVGPRPERRFFIDQFTADIPLFPLRLRVRPGVTSLSHVWGRYDSSPAHRLIYDLVYIKNISFMLDMRILLETVKVVLTGRGAQ